MEIVLARRPKSIDLRCTTSWNRRRLSRSTTDCANKFRDKFWDVCVTSLTRRISGRNFDYFVVVPTSSEFWRVGGRKSQLWKTSADVDNGDYNAHTAASDSHRLLIRSAAAAAATAPSSSIDCCKRNIVAERNV